jgi:1-deoxy-D-xylulose 5-phosphate reductoisomerase
LARLNGKIETKKRAQGQRQDTHEVEVVLLAPINNDRVTGTDKPTMLSIRLLLLVLLQLLVVPASAFSPVATNHQQQQRQSTLSARKDGWIDPSAPVNSVESLKKTAQKALEGSNFCKRLSLLGSTGSIGTQTLEIVDACPNNFVVDALSAGTNAKLMAEQVIKYRPKLCSMATPQAANELNILLKGKMDQLPEIVYGDEGTVLAATVASADTVVTGIVGAAGLQPTIEAIKLGKDIALANKETLISGGPVINPLVEKHGVNMVCWWSSLFCACCAGDVNDDCCLTYS